MTKRIIQFGTSRFLQAHADLFVHEARASGQDIGPITVVKTTRGTERAGRVSAFGTAEGYPVIIRGLVDGKTKDSTIQVTSIDNAMIADRDWQKLKELFVNEAQVVISNVGESGYAIPTEDEVGAPTANQVPASFPAKLLSLLHARYLAGGKSLLILPCELISENGIVLRQILVELANKWKLDPEFNRWMSAQVTICDTLVDRIVSEAIEPVGAVAEPYALWAIKREASCEIPFTHPAIVVTDDLEPFLRLKLHILNLGHSFLAEIWRTEKRHPPSSVSASILEPAAISNVKPSSRSISVASSSADRRAFASKRHMVSTSFVARACSSSRTRSTCAPLRTQPPAWDEFIMRASRRCRATSLRRRSTGVVVRSARSLRVCSKAIRNAPAVLYGPITST